MSVWGKCLVLVLSIASTAVVRGEEPWPFKAKPAGDYSAHQTISGVTVGAETYELPELMRAPFGKVNPYEHGVLPVLVVIENKGKSTIRLEGMQVQYVTPDRTKVDSTPARDLAYLQGPRRPDTAPSPIPRRKPKNVLASPELEQRAFAAKVLPPGEKAFGFFYFQTGVRNPSQLYITGLQDAATNQELFYFEIPLIH